MFACQLTLSDCARSWNMRVSIAAANWQHNHPNRLAIGNSIQYNQPEITHQVVGSRDSVDVARQMPALAIQTSQKHNLQIDKKAYIHAHRLNSSIGITCA